MMYKYPKIGVRDYAEAANPELLNELEAEVENYNTNDYQTPEIAALCTQILIDTGFSTDFSFDPDEQVDLQADHIRAYKQLRIAIFQFHTNSRQLELLLKLQDAHKWIEAQKEVEQALIHSIIAPPTHVAFRTRAHLQATRGNSQKGVQFAKKLKSSQILKEH